MAAALLSSPNSITRHLHPWHPQSSWSPATGPRRNCSVTLPWHPCRYTTFSRQVPGNFRGLKSNGNIRYFTTSIIPKLHEKTLLASYQCRSVFDEKRASALSCDDDDDDDDHELNWKKKKNLEALAVDAISKAFELVPKAGLVSAVMAAVLFLSNPYLVALAASGGRMGGRSFSSGSNSSSSSYSGSSSSWGSSSSSSPSYSSWYSSSSEDDDDYGTNNYSSPSSYWTTMSSSSTSNYGADTSSSGSKTSSSPEADVLAALLFMIFFCQSFSAFVSLYPKTSGSKSSQLKTSGAKLQVGLLGSCRPVQRQLNQIAEVADTSTPKGFSYILTETILALLRNPDYWISGYSYVEGIASMDEAERYLNQFSIEELGKIDEETLVNEDNAKSRSSSSRRDSEVSNEYLVVTILVAGEGIPELPSINSSEDLRKALEKLASVTTTRTLAVEVLWTPQIENDILTEAEYRQKYPSLRPF